MITKNVIILTHLPVFFEFNLHKILFRASQCPEEPEGSPTFFFIFTAYNVDRSSESSVVARRRALSNQKTTEDNTLNVPCRKYVETI